jgi:hypothetical protein
MASSGPVIGDEPTDGLQGDAQGPVERQASLTSGMTVALGLTIQIEYRAVGRIYFRLRLGGVQPAPLHFHRKR